MTSLPAQHCLATEAERWIEQARNGSREALGQLLDAFRSLLLAVAGEKLPTYLRAKGGASDLVQDTFLEAQRDFADFQGACEPEVRKWLCRILERNVLNFVRQ